MRNHITATSIALILPALSACSYMPGSDHQGFNTHPGNSYHSSAYVTGKTTPSFSHSLDSSYGYQGTQTFVQPAHAQAGHHGQSFVHPSQSQGGCHSYVQPSVQYQIQPCAQSNAHQSPTPTYNTHDAVYYDGSICGPVGCAPHDTYSVGGDHHTSTPLRGSYKSDYIYSNIGGVAYDAGGDLFGVVGRLGYQSKTIFGAEAEGTLGLNNTTIQDAGTTINGGVDYSVAAFALARLPVSDKFSVHARGGYHVTRVSADSDDGTTQVSAAEAFDGFAYGGGAEFNMTERDSIRVDYTRYEYEPQNPAIGNVDAQDTVSVAWARKF